MGMERTALHGDTIQDCKCMDDLELYPPFLDLSLLTERSIITSEQANTATRQLLKDEGIFARQSKPPGRWMRVILW
jgi:hypothetical protein